MMSTDPDPPFWTPARVRWALRHWADLRAGVRPPRDPNHGYSAASPNGWATWERAIDTWDGIQSAMLWLAMADPHLAAVIWSLYCEPGLAEFVITKRRVVVADDEGVHWSTLYRWEKRAIEDMAERLGYVAMRRGDE